MELMNKPAYIMQDLTNEEFAKLKYTFMENGLCIIRCDQEKMKLKIQK